MGTANRKSSDVKASDIPVQDDKIRKEVINMVSCYPVVCMESHGVSETTSLVIENVTSRDAEEENEHRLLHYGQERVEVPVGIVDKLHRGISIMIVHSGHLKMCYS